MSNRRMFSNRIANSARFLQMPSEAQLLYFHLVLRADDDGVVEAYPVIRLLNVPIDNFRILVAKNMIKELNEDQVIVISDWLEHNTIRADRKVDSIYKELLTSKYPELPLIQPKPRSDVKDNSARIDSGPSTVGISQVKLSQVKLSQDNRESTDTLTVKIFSSRKDITQEILQELADIHQVPIDFIANSWDTACNWLDAKGKVQKNYKAFLSNWVKKDKADYLLKQGRVKSNLGRGGVYDAR